MTSLSPSLFADAFLTHCSGCRTDRDSSMFVGRTRPYRTCTVCRYRQTAPSIAPMFDNMVFLNDLPIDENFFSQGTDTMFEMDIYLNDEMVALDDDALVNEIFDAVERKTGNRHYRQRIGDPITSQAIIFYGTCMQRIELHQRLDPSRRIRQVVAMPTYDCRREIKGHIRRDQNWIHLEINHHLNHQPHQTQRVFLTQEEVDFLRSNATTMTNPGLYHAAIRQFGNHITREQVYHWRLGAIRDSYQLDPDQYVSTRMLINQWNCHGYEELLWIDDVRYTALAFKTPFFDLCVQSTGDNMVKEYHIDSTYRTSRSDCELFAVIGNVNGAGFPVAYMFFKHNRQETDETLTSGCKIPALTAMFGSMQERGLNPTFMFCDKDVSEIASIINTWGPHKVRLCLWHLKQAVDRGLSKTRGLPPVYDVGAAIAEFPFVDRQFMPNRAVGSILVVKTHREAITRMMGDHYSRHPMFFEGGRNFAPGEFDRLSRMMHCACAHEAYMYCRENGLSDGWAYLWRNWYTFEKWVLWARSVTFEVPSAKSTMLVESHWRVLKRNYLYHFNRPRLDLLVYIITKELCANLINTYHQKVVLRRDLFGWEKEFVKTWNDHHRQENDPPRHPYITNYEQWVCNCPCFYQSQFLLCKHIVRSSGLGYIARHQFFIKRNVERPFIELRDPTAPNQYHPGTMEDSNINDIANTMDRRHNRAHRNQRGTNNNDPTPSPIASPTAPPVFQTNASPTLSDLFRSPTPLDHHRPSPTTLDPHRPSPISPHTFLNNISPTLSDLISSPTPFNPPQQQSTAQPNPSSPLADPYLNIELLSPPPAVNNNTPAPLFPDIDPSPIYTAPSGSIDETTAREMERNMTQSRSRRRRIQQDCEELQRQKEEKQRQKEEIQRQQEEIQRRIELLNEEREAEEQEEERFAATYVQNIPQRQVEVFRNADRDEYLRVVPASRRRNTNPRTRGEYHPLTENL